MTADDWLMCGHVALAKFRCSYIVKIKDFKIYDAAARRRGLQNKRIIRARQSEWIICSPKSILNTVLVL